MEQIQEKDQEFTLSKEGVALIKKEMTRYETKLSCLIPCLYQIQKEKGWISPEAVKWLGKQTGVPESYIQEVLMFYTLFNKKSVGKFHVQVCCNVSCFMQGGRELAKSICDTFQVKEGEISADGNWTVSRVECLGACDLAPVMQVNDQYLGKLKGERAIHVLRGLAHEAPVQEE